MKVGDLIRFSQEHQQNPGHDYTEDWLGIIVEKVMDSKGVLKEIHIYWKHGQVSDYPSSWWDTLPYEPFDVVNEGR